MSGLGGIGKTYICREVVHRCLQGEDFHDLVWLNAQSGLEQELKSAVASYFNVDVSDGAQWLSQLVNRFNQSTSPSVLFIDNLDSEQDNQAILNTLRRTKWHIVATSRHKPTGFETTIPVKPLSYGECIDLFIYHYDQGDLDDERTQIGRIVEYCGRHTLLFTLWAKVAASEGIELDELETVVGNSEFDLSGLSDEPVEALHSGTEFADRRQFQIHQHLSRLFDFSDVAADELDILRILAVLPSEQYKGDWLRQWFNVTRNKPFISLAKQGWLERDGNVFFLHPAIAYMVKEKVLLNHKQFADFATELADFVTPELTGHWIESAPWLAHLNALLDEKMLPEVLQCKVQGRLGCVLESQGNYWDALSLYEETLAVSERVLGPEHLDTLTSKNNLASLYESIGDYDQALHLYKETLASRERTLGFEHPDTLTSKNNLAHLYKSIGRYEQALPLYEEALAVRASVLGPEHPDTLSTKNNLAVLYRSMGQYEFALPLYEKTLAVRERVLGPEHPDTLSTKNNLASLYESMGNYEQALSLHEETLAARERVLGPEHPDTLSSKNNMAYHYTPLGKYKEALSLFEEAFVGSMKALGEDHPTTQTIKGNLDTLKAILSNDPSQK
nr:tetratricopeptide repeat protein [Pseudoalteromonas viridis]